MKLPRQFPQLVGTGILLAVVLLGLRLTAPSDASSVNNKAKPTHTAAGSKLDFDQIAAMSSHGDAELAPSGSFEFQAPRSSGKMDRVSVLENDHKPDSDIFSHDIHESFGDPLIAGFKELNTMKLRTVEPRLAGHSLTAFGRRAVVEEAGPVSGTTGVMLSLSIDPITSAPDEILPLPEPDKIAPPENAPGSAHMTSWKGLSYEQELFRTKWGWQAFDQVQKVLREQQSP